MTPAEQLEGMNLINGWTVKERILHDGGHSGGRFSVPYIIENIDGKKAFLKALDYSEALDSPDPARALQALTEAYNFERDLLEQCGLKKMDRIVRAIEFGKTKIGPASVGVVEYIIFELANTDLRAQYDRLLGLDYAWKYRTLHNIAVGIWQLHKAKISHQDLKPSNVLLFDKDTSKLADLGRAAFKEKISPHEDLRIAGDMTYAPPELLYNEIPDDWGKRRFGCDLFLLGSMISYLFTGLPINTILYSHLSDEFHFSLWDRDFREVLPHLREAFLKTKEQIKCEIKIEELVPETMELVNYLCEVDPDLRGHPRNKIGVNNPYSVERFISKLDLLHDKAQYYLRK